MPRTEVDILIVGQGLAGSLLAFELIQHKQKVLVVDNDNFGSSSKVAAGIINPITGHRLNLTHNFSSFYKSAKKVYSEIEHKLGHQVLFEISQHRLIKNSGQASYFGKRLEDSEYHAFLETAEPSFFGNTEYGVAQVKQTAYVDVKKLLEHIKHWLLKIGAYHSAKLNYEKIQFQPSHVRVGLSEGRDVYAKKIVFCEGYQASNNPWLKDLPFKFSKGEVLTMKNTEQLRVMLNWGNWYLPLDKKFAKFGSNYAWGDLSLAPNNQVKTELLERLPAMLKGQAEAVKHEAGIRPTTLDRQPFIGPVSDLNNAYCFNGFGSKGCLTIPQHARDLRAHLLNMQSLPDEVCKWL